MSLTRTRLASSAVLTCAALAVALAGCTSDQSEPAGIGNVDMAVTLATPPSGPNEQIDAVNVSLWCAGVDPVLGVPRPPQSSPETFSINTSTSQGPEPKNTIGLFEKQGLPAGPCTFTFTATSNTGNTECTGEVTVMVDTNATADGSVVLACIHTPRYGGVRSDGTFNQCAEYRQILVTPTTQSIGNLVDVRTEVYDPDGDLVTVEVTTDGACGNVQSTNGDTAASCGANISGCAAVANTVECTGVGLCQIIVAVSDDEFTSCTGLLPNGSNNDAARQTIDVDCTVASGCGNGELEPGEDCDPPDGIFCDQNCQDIDNCSPDPCNQGNVCSPEVCTADPGDNSAICTPDPGAAAGNACSPPAGGTCDGEGTCVACTLDTECEDNNACTDNACVAGECVFTPDDNNTCSTGGLPGTCNAGTCEGLCTGVTCPDAGECVTNVCDPADASCNPQNDGINTGCDLGGGPGSGVCDGQGTCVECTMDSQCDTGAGETCVNNACEAPVVNLCTTTAQAFIKTLDPGAGFATTNNIVFDTTDLPDTWGTYTITLDLSDQALQGQILQFGYQTLAKDFQPAGNFYDNNVAAVAGYSQDFNGLDPADPAALSGDGWLYFANVYNADGSFKFDFGQTFPAPTTSGQISAIAVGEGGPDQNPNQLVIFSNYDCCDLGTASPQGHGNGTDLVETIVFQEPFSNAEGGIPQSWIGQTFEFTFDAKRGNINDPADEKCAPNGGGGGNLTVNGDFETGDFTGWTNFCDNGLGSCTITSDNPNGGQFAASVSQSTPAQNAVIKQERIAAGQVATGDTIAVELFIRGSAGVGGVVFLEVFSEETGGNVVQEGIFGIPLTSDWAPFSQNVTLTGNPGDGITVQIAAVTGGDPASFVDIVVDDVSATQQ